MGAVTVLDTSGRGLEALRFEPRPDIIKPNIAEFNQLTNDGLIPDNLKNAEPDVKESYLRENCLTNCGKGDEEQASDFWKLLLRQVRTFHSSYPGMKAAMISLGQAGILLVLQERILHAHLEGDVTIKSPVGAGDAALAAFIFTLDNKQNWDEALKWAVAAGAAAVEKPGTESPTADRVKKLCNQVKMHVH